jgi:hypothetical protein
MLKSDLPQVAVQQRNATLAQLVERLIRNQQVAGSIPAGGSRTFLIIKDFPGSSNLQIASFGSNCAKTPSRGLCARTLYVVCFAIEPGESFALSGQPWLEEATVTSRGSAGEEPHCNRFIRCLPLNYISLVGGFARHIL